MQRRKKPAKWVDRVSLADETVRLNPFQIARSGDEASAKTMLRKSYGNNGDRISVRGRITEDDRGVLVALHEMTGETNKPINFRLSDIAKAMGVKNPYAESTLGPIREGIDRLLDAEVRLNLGKPSREKKLRAVFKFLIGHLNSDDTGNITVGNYLDIIQDLALGWTCIKPSLYFSIRSQIARGLYVFLQSHEAICHGGYYQVRLSKLCNYINYDPAGRAWSLVWQPIDSALTQLVRAGILAKYVREKNRLRKDGGVVTVWGPPKQLKAKEEKAKEKKIGVLTPSDIFQREFSELPATRERVERDCFNPASSLLSNANDGSESELAQNMVDFARWFKKKQQRPNWRDLDPKDPHQHAIRCKWEDEIPTAWGFVQKYIEWLADQQWLDEITPAIFTPGNGVVQKFIQYHQKQSGWDIFTGERKENY